VRAAANAGSAASGSGRGTGPAQAKQSGGVQPAPGSEAAKQLSSKMLNGNAAAFVPTLAAPLPPPNSMASAAPMPNGTISYRNAAGEWQSSIVCNTPFTLQVQD
jgi:hypothetical protein